MPNPYITTRDFHIDLIEFVAIIFVLLYHSTIDRCDVTSSNDASVHFRYWLRSILSTCVPLFFFANGYLLLNKPWNFQKHIRKTIKIVLLFVVWSALTLYAKMYIDGEYLGIKETIASTLFLKPGWNNHLWFLKVLTIIYVLFPVIRYLYEKRRIFLYFTFICIVSTMGSRLAKDITTFLSSFVPHHSSLNSIDFSFGFLPMQEWHWWAFVFFCVGGLAYNYKSKIMSISSSILNLTALAGILVNSSLLYITGYFYSRNEDKYFDIVWNGYNTLFTLFNVLCIWILCLNMKSESKLIRYISMNTLGIYLIHSIFQFILRPVLLQFSFRGLFVNTMAFAFVTLLLSIMTVWLMRKASWSKWLVS